MKKNSIFLILFLSIVIFALSCSESNLPIYGTWNMLPEKSTDIVTWRYRTLEMDIINHEGEVTILDKWMQRKKVAFVDSVTFTPDGTPAEIEVTSQIWPENWYMGVLSMKGSMKKVSGVWLRPDKELETITEQPVQTSQGEATITTTRTFKLNRKGNELTVIEKRSSRPTPIELVFERVVVE